MNKKKIFILISLIIIIIAIAVILVLMNKKNGLTFNKQADNAKLNQANPAVSEVLDVKKIDTQKELSQDDMDVVASDLFTVPKDISGIELMSNEEKTKMGLDVNLVIQVLGRLPDGRPAGYKFINSEADLLLDTRK